MSYWIVERPHLSSRLPSVGSVVPTAELPSSRVGALHRLGFIRPAAREELPLCDECGRGPYKNLAAHRRTHEGVSDGN